MTGISADEPLVPRQSEYRLYGRSDQRRLRPGASHRHGGHQGRCDLLVAVADGHVLEHVVAHFDHGVVDLLGFHQLVALRVDHAALVVGHVVVVQQMLTHVEVVRFHLALGVLDGAVQHPRLDRLVFPTKIKKRDSQIDVGVDVPRIDCDGGLILGNGVFEAGEKDPLDPTDDQCDGAGHPQHDVGVTALAAHAFLHAGVDPDEGRWSLVLRRALDALVAQQHQRGMQFVLCDPQLPPQPGVVLSSDGIEVLRRLRAERPGLPVIMVSGQGTIERAVEATQLGALDFMEKPFSRDPLLLSARNAMELNELRRELLAGLVVEFRTRNTQSGSRMAFITLDDRSARMEIRIFSKVFEQYRALLANDTVLVVQGTLAFDDFSGSMRLNANKIYEIDQAREVYAKRLVVNVGEQKAGNGFVRSLADILSPYCEGNCPVGIQYQGTSAQAHITLGEQWWVHPTDELLHRLRELTSSDQVRVEY